MIDLMNFMEQMGNSNMPLVAAFFIGMMMSISPCPLATNITAIAYSSRDINNRKKTLLSGLFYTIGRMLTYMTITIMIMYAGMSSQAIALPLQKYGNLFLGPALIFFALVMMDVMKFNIKLNGLSGLNEKLAGKGYIGNFIMGATFSLAFCPFSAVLFFGMLIPLVLKFSDGVLIPAVFAFSTGLPVIIFSLILTYSASRIGKVFNKVQLFEKLMRRFVSIVLLILGIYYTISIFR